MKLQPTHKQYVALMYLGVIPMELPLDNGDWQPLVDPLGKPLYDMETTELGYGGAAGGGKTHLGCEWLVTQCINFPGTRWFIGRKELKVLKRTVLPTLFKVLASHGLQRDVDYKYNEVNSEFNFMNAVDGDVGSQILLLDLMTKPSDPHFTEYGSLEVTGGWFEEANELEESAFEILQSRCRYRLEDFCPYCSAKQTREVNFVRVETTDNPNPITEDDKIIIRNLFHCHDCDRDHYGIVPRVMCTFNPDKGWVYNRFYKPFREGRMPANAKFIPALATDNPYLPAGYLRNLQMITDKVKRERLLKGNFDYDDTPGRLFDYDALTEVFKRMTQSQLNQERQQNDALYRLAVQRYGKTDVTDYEYHMICDPARFGEDLAVIGVWNKLSLEKLIVYFKSDLMEDLYKTMDKERTRRNISNNRIVVDADGLGGGLVDMLRCKGFVNKSSPIQPKGADKDPMKRENYEHLKTQCYFKVAELIDEIAIDLDSEGAVEVHGGELSPNKIKEMIIEELDVIVQIEMDRDGPTKLIKKEDVKKKLGRSPNFADMIMMRMYSHVKPGKTAFVHK